MTEMSTASNELSLVSSNNENPVLNTDTIDNPQQNNNSTSIMNTTAQSSKISTQSDTDFPVYKQSSSDMNHSMSKLSIHASQFQPKSEFSYYDQPTSQYTPYLNQPDTQAQLVAFTPPLMSLRLSYGQNQTRPRSYRPTRPFVPRQQTPVPRKTKPETVASQPKYYMDSFSSNFADKPSLNNNDMSKPKTKHVTFQEPQIINESSRIDTNNNNNNMSSAPPPSASTFAYYPSQYWRSSMSTYPHSRSSYQRYYSNNNNYYYPPSDEFYPQYSYMIANQNYMPRPHEINMMPTSYTWSAPSSFYGSQGTSYGQNSFQSRQLYDPNRPKIPPTSESQSFSQPVLRHIVPKNKKKSKSASSTESSTVSTPEPISHPITILRKPSIDPEVTSPPTDNQSTTVSKEEDEQQEEQSASTIESFTAVSELEHSSNIPSEIESTTVSSTDNSSKSESIVSFPSDELLSILQSANCISSLNEYAQQKKCHLNYEFPSPSSSSSSFTCVLSINNRQFPSSPPCSSKAEAQKLACDQALRMLYRESCSTEASSLQFSSKHDYIAYRSVSTFQGLNVNELLLGRKTLACMLMITDENCSQAEVISIGTGNACLDETNLSYANDGTSLHDCHAEILARRGLIKYFFQQIKQSKQQMPSIFEYDSTLSKYQLRENITFHMYISSLPCGNASLNISSNAIRYKQGQIEGTSLTPTNYPIKSCSDKIYRWNILGIQGGLLINLLTKPIYLQSITIACETTFDRQRVNSSLAEHSKEHFHSLPLPYLFHIPDIDCPTIKSFQQERQVAKLQSNAFAWNRTESEKTELLEPMTGRIKKNRLISSLSKQNFLREFLELIPENSLTYQQAKQLDKTYLLVKNLISTMDSSDNDIPSWKSKSDQLEQFTIE